MEEIKEPSQEIMKIFYTESEGGKWVEAFTSKTKEEIINKLKESAKQPTGKLVTEKGTFDAHSILFPDNTIYYVPNDKEIDIKKDASRKDIRDFFSYMQGVVAANNFAEWERKNQQESFDEILTNAEITNQYPKLADQLKTYFSMINRSLWRIFTPIINKQFCRIGIAKDQMAEMFYDWEENVLYVKNESGWYRFTNRKDMPYTDKITDQENIRKLDNEYKYYMDSFNIPYNRNIAEIRKQDYEWEQIMKEREKGSPPELSPENMEKKGPCF